MAVNILQRPQGHVLSATEKTATVTDDYGGVYALFTAATHGLTTGDYIYVDSDIETYNGFKYVQVINTNSFRVKVYALDDPAEYVQDATVSYYESTQTHGWSCVHLPIVYRLTNDRYPVNSIDTARTISTLADSGGYARITLSGALGTFEELSFVKISSAPASDLDGVYQIIDKISTSDVVISLSSTVTEADLIGATIQLYYSSYNINVRIYAGLNASHQWAAYKTYELAETIQLIPDSNNEVKFSVSEILKSYINTRNNLQLATLPFNIDFFTQFYIEIAESFDLANGYTVGTFLDSFTSDQANFEGYAVNAKLPFKLIHSGYMSEYILSNSTSKFLTLFGTPVLSEGSYQDISFINPIQQTVVIKKEYYLNGVLQTTDQTSLGLLDAGIIRHQPTIICTYDRVDITVVGLSETKTFTIDCNCTNQDMRLSWLNYLGGLEYWNFTSEKEYSVDVTETGETVQNTFPTWPDSYGEFADSIRKQTHRDSRDQILVRSQYLTLDQVQAIKYIRTSPLVQIVNSRKDRRTVIVDSDSFTVYTERDKLYTTQFSISYTDDIPSQRI